MSKNDPLALPHMAAFQCIGAECENTCCQGWKIAVDRETMTDLARRMSRSPREQQQFDRGLEPNPGAHPDGEDAAYLRRREDGFCFFFDAGLCSLQSTYGDRALGRACSSFPRIAKRDGPHLIMGGDLGCPEVVRLLLRFDRTLVPEKISAEKLPLKLIVSDRHGRESLPTRERALVLKTMDHLFQAHDHPFKSRMYMLAYLAHRLGRRLEEPSPGIAPAAVIAECRDLSAPEIRAELASQFEHLPLTGQAAFPALYGNLRQRLGRGLPGFRSLCLQVFETYEPRDPPAPMGDPKLLFRQFCKRRNQLLRVAGQTIDDYFQKAAFHLWFLERIRPTAHLVAYLPLLFFYLAEMKFLFFSHPHWRDRPPEPGQKPPHLEKIAVEVIHHYARSTFHGKRTEREYGDLIRGAGFDRPPRLLELLQLL